jgi:predicted Zn-dependent peptidase
MAAHGAPMTRLRRLKAIDDVKAEDVARLVTGTGARVLMLEPDGDIPGAHDMAEVGIGLHHVEVVRPTASTDLAPPPRPAHRIDASIIEDHLPNGLTVWLAPDSSAFSIAARVVMPLDVGNGSTRDLATQAAGFLRAQAVSDTDAVRTVRWYQSVGVPVKWMVGETAAVFGVDGFALFGDWHVWNLAWTLVDGTYPPWLDSLAGSQRPATDDPPDALTVLARRLRGDTAADSPVFASRDQLAQFRASHFDPARATLIVTGNFDVEAMRREIRTLFGRWKSSGVKPAPPTVTHASPGFVAVPVVHSATLDIAIGFAGSTGAPAADAVLGEILSDRLRTIREGLGISYGVHAVIDRDVILHGSVEPGYAAEAAKAMLDVIKSVRDGDPAFVADFVAARKRVLAAALAEFSGPSAHAGELVRAAIEGHGLGELDRTVEEIRTVSIDDVRRIAEHDLHPEGMIVVVRGRSDAIKAAMSAFGAAGFDTVTR